MTDRELLRQFQAMLAIDLQEHLERPPHERRVSLREFASVMREFASVIEVGVVKGHIEFPE